MLKINSIEVLYSDVILVLRGVSLELGDGAIVALLGANGAGKTTTVKAISGLLKTELGKVSRGSIEFDGKRIENGDPREIAKSGIIQVLEGRRLFEHLSVEDNIMTGVFAQKSRHSNIKDDLDMVYSYFPRLKDLRGTTSGYLSGGEQQMLVVGRALIAHPKIMLLDEPSLGLAPRAVRELFDVVKKINAQEGTAVLLVEQNAKIALDIAEHAYVMENGRIVLDGSAEKLKNDEDIKEFYLGLSQVGERKSYKTVKHYKRRKRWLV